MAGAINARLRSAAELVGQGAVLADIGTDHAYLPLFLLSEGRITYAFASDVNEGPLASARKNAEDCGLTDKMSFILTDGAAALSGKGITDYTVCGMGGELIADIIDRAPHLSDGTVRLILQPMSRQEKLRAYLYSHGFEILTESYSLDAGKYYVCLEARYVGKCREISDTEAYMGVKGSKIVNKNCQKGYLEAKIASLARSVEGKAEAGKQDEREEKILHSLKEYIKSF